MVDDAARSPTGGWWSEREPLRVRYHAQLPGLCAILDALRQEIEALLAGAGLRATVKCRVKRFEAFYQKLLERSRVTEIGEPFAYLTDTLGLRVVAPFLADIPRIEALLRDRFDLEEVDDKARRRSPVEFGYDGTHLLAAIPEHMLHAHGPTDLHVVEVQLRTTLQDAWAEVEHELVYKADLDLVDAQLRRKLTALNATLTLADGIFQEIRDFQRRRFAELRRRHQLMMEQVATLPEQPAPWSGPPSDRGPSALDGDFVPDPDDPQAELSSVLVRALQAHIDADLGEAIGLYSEVLAIQPTYAVYNHRGLAYVALSEYAAAIADFTAAIALAPTDAHAYTNRAVAHRMAGQLHEALADLDRSLELNAAWADTLFVRALTLFDLGNVPAALRDCDRAIALKPTFKQVIRFKQYIHSHEL